ncbi:MAG: deoxyguanosinetriphosphate triphosphohydrolase [Caulobacterales bacterium]
MANGARAIFAVSAERSRGRLHKEPESATRTPYQRDRDRIIHCTAFRRLKQKTQVFVAHEGDHYRTRLTHSLEVAQIARSGARVLGLDEDLTETLALAHDLGHPPFGHAGERALNERMKAYGGFDHNAQALRLVTKLEERYPAFDGLNLTWETLEGLVKPNGPLVGPLAPPSRHGALLPGYITEYDALHSLDLQSFASLEAQMAALADDIAYNNHDIDDGVHAGLFTLEEVAERSDLVARAMRETRSDFPKISEPRLLAEVVRRLIGVWMNDLLIETRKRLAEARPDSEAAVRAAGKPLAAFSEGMRTHDEALRAFLSEKMYRHYKVNRMMSQAQRVVVALFDLFLAEPDTLPPEWQVRAKGQDMNKRARVVCDYISGMTDSFALDEHRRLFNLERWI